LITVTAEDQAETVRRYRLALGSHAFGATFTCFLKRRNPAPSYYAKYHPEGTERYRDTRGLPYSQAGPAFQGADGSEWIVCAGPDGPTCVYRYAAPTESARDSWELD